MFLLKLCFCERRAVVAAVPVVAVVGFLLYGLDAQSLPRGSGFRFRTTDVYFVGHELSGSTSSAEWLLVDTSRFESFCVKVPLDSFCSYGYFQTTSIYCEIHCFQMIICNVVRLMKLEALCLTSLTY